MAEFSAGQAASVWPFLEIAFGLALIAYAVRSLRAFFSNRIEDADTRYRARKAVVFIGILAAMVVVLVSWGGSLSNLTLALGAAGAGIAFALQEVIASFAGWLALMMGGFYRVGDRVQLGGIKGDVIDVSILRTTLMEIGGWVDGDLYNGRIVRIANSFVFKEPVFNYSASFPFVWDEILIPIRFGSDRVQVRKIIEQIAQEELGDYAQGAQRTWDALVREYRVEQARIQPMVTLRVTDNWLEYTLRYVVDFKRRRATKDILFERLMSAIDDTAGSVRLASMTVELVGNDPVRHGSDMRGRDEP